MQVSVYFKNVIIIAPHHINGWALAYARMSHNPHKISTVAIYVLCLEKVFWHERLLLSYICIIIMIG